MLPPKFRLLCDHPVWSYGTFQLYVLSAGYHFSGNLEMLWNSTKVREKSGKVGEFVLSGEM